MVIFWFKQCGGGTSRDISVNWMEFEVEEMFTCRLTLRKIFGCRTSAYVQLFIHEKLCVVCACSGHKTHQIIPIPFEMYWDRKCVFFFAFSLSLSVCLWKLTCRFARFSFNSVVLATQYMVFTSKTEKKTLWHDGINAIYRIGTYRFDTV